MDRLKAIFSRITHLLQVSPQFGRLAFNNVFSRSSVVGSADVDVSLTTYSTRSKRVFLTIESIAAGAVRPRRLILWIDDEGILNALPKSLRRLQRRGLEIKHTLNYGPHKKYYSYVESEEQFYIPLVTADDDIIYPQYWLLRLLNSYRSFPNAISCFRAHSIALNEGTIAPYRSWTACTTNVPSYRTFSTGASGALYPPDFLGHLKDLGTEFLDVAPRADDVWLHGTAVDRGILTRQIDDVPAEFSVIPGTQHLALSRHNVSMDGNDEQIEATYQTAQIERLLMNGPAS